MAKRIKLEPIAQEASVKTNDNLLSMLLKQELNVKWKCGGRGCCSTCHVYIQEGGESLSPKSRRELKTLALISNCEDNSRLACQARVLGEGVIVELPVGMYLSEIDDLNALIGRRVQQPILHPLDGKVLVEEGMVITRSMIQQLEQAKVQIDKYLSSV